MRELPEYSLFNAADDCLAHYVGEDSFNESLLLNVLFQEKVLVHEAYFFNSTLLTKHIQGAKGEPSLFELAAQRGIVVPAFRHRQTGTLEEAYELMKKEDVYGESYDLLHPAMQPFLDRLIGSVNVGLRNSKPFYWPASDDQDESLGLGNGYYRIISELLQTQEPPEYAQHDGDRKQLFERVWTASKRWRQECVEEAVKGTQRKGAQGLQRTELFYALGRSLGMAENIATIGVADLVSHCKDEEQALCMEVFLKWITQCHHLNQARTFGTAINFPVYSIDRDFIIDSLLRSPVDPAPALSEGFRCEVLLPPVATLLQSGSPDVLAIRADLGLGYLNALKRWQGNPSDENQGAVENSLRDYCDQISARYDRTVLQPLVASFTKGTSSYANIVGDTATATAAILTPGSSVGFFVSVAKLVHTTYQYVRRKRLKATLSARGRELELTLAHK